MIQKSLIAALILLLGIVSNAYPEDDGSILLNNVFKAAGKCLASSKVGQGLDSAFCLMKATPKRCQAQATAYIVSGGRGGAISALYICVAYCASSGYWSNHFGECSREIQ